MRHATQLDYLDDIFLFLSLILPEFAILATRYLYTQLLLSAHNPVLPTLPLTTCLLYKPVSLTLFGRMYKYLFP